MHKFIGSIALIAALAAIGLSPAVAFAGEVKDSGSFDGTYSKRDMQPIPDQDGHALMLTESSGTAVSPGGLVNGFSVITRELADLRQGNGPQQGYSIFSKGPDQQVVKFEGMVTTTLKDGKPNTTMKGTYAIVSGTGALAGVSGEGTYTGYFTAEDKFRVDWEGTRTIQKDAMASPGKN
jgi:hypothetical protein